jgi:MFS family permease
VPRYRATIAFALATTFFGYAFMQRVAPSVITEELMREFEVGAAALGSLSAFYFYTYAAVQIPVGLLMDRIGPRKLMSTALLICTLASLGFAYSETVLVASLARALIGGTVAFAFVGSLTIAALWFPPNRFVLLSGLVMTVGMMGAMLGQAPLRLSVDALGWRTTIASLAAIATGLAVMIFLLVPNRDAELHSVGSKPGMFGGLGSVVSNPQNWICAGIGFGVTGTLLAFSGLWAVPWLHSVHGYDKAQAAGITSLIFLGWAVGAPIAGWLSDRLGRRKPIILALITLSLGSFALIIYSGTGHATTLALLFFSNGVGSSGMVVSFGAVRDLNPPAVAATAFGLLNMFVVASGAVMQPLLGWMLDKNWTGQLVEGARVYSAEAYSATFTILVFGIALSLVCGLLVRETYCRPVENAT